MLKKDLYSYRNKILEICEAEDIKKLILFGSTAREESN